MKAIQSHEQELSGGKKTKKQKLRCIEHSAAFKWTVSNYVKKFHLNKKFDFLTLQYVWKKKKTLVKVWNKLQPHDSDWPSAGGEVLVD